MQINPLEPIKHEGAKPLPQIKFPLQVQEEKKPIDLNASPKDHPPLISSIPITSAIPLIREEEFELLNLEAHREIKKQKKMKKAVKEGIIEAIPKVVQEGFSRAGDLLSDAQSSVGSALSGVSSIFSLVTTPINIIKSWQKFSMGKETEKRVRSSKPLDDAKREDFFESLNILMNTPGTKKEDVESFLFNEGISLRQLKAHTSTSAFNKMKKGISKDTELQEELWAQHKTHRGQAFRDKLLESNTLESAVKDLMKIGVPLPEKITSKEELMSALLNDQSFANSIDDALAVAESRIYKMEEMLKKRKDIEQKRTEDLEPAFIKALNMAGSHLRLALENDLEKREKLKQIVAGLAEMGIGDLVPYIESKEAKALEKGDEEELRNIQSLKHVFEKRPIKWEYLGDKELTEAAIGLLSLIDDKEYYPSFLKDHVNHHETLSASIRNGMKAMSSIKLEQEKKSFLFTLAETTLLGTFTILSAAVGLVGLIGSFTGIFTLPSIVLLILGGIGTGLSVGSMAAGGIHAYFTRPNRLKESIFKLRDIRKTFSSIPYHYRKYYFDKALLKKKKNNLAVFAISAKLQGQFSEEMLEKAKPNLKPEIYELLKKPGIDPIEKQTLEEKHKHYKDKAAIIEGDLTKAFAEYSIAERRYEKHKGAFSKAGVKDLASTYPEAELLFAKTKTGVPNIADALALMHKAEGGSGIDAMTRDALKNYTGIDLDALSDKEKDEFISARTLFEREMKAFYGGTIDDVLGQLK